MSNERRGLFKEEDEIDPLNQDLYEASSELPEPVDIPGEIDEEVDQAIADEDELAEASVSSSVQDPMVQRQSLLEQYRKLQQFPEAGELRSAQEERRRQMRNLALLRAGSQIGQAFAGKYSGKFDVDDSGIKALEDIQKQKYEDVKETQKETGERASAKLYRDLIKERNPNLEIDPRVRVEHLKGLLTSFKQGVRPAQQSDYILGESHGDFPPGTPAIFIPEINAYTIPGTDMKVPANKLIRNYTKTITDPRTGEIIEVRPGIGSVGPIAGAPSKSPQVVSKEQEKDYTYEMLNPKQRELLSDLEKEYREDVKDSREFGETLAQADDLIDSDLSAAIPAIKRMLARSVGREVGVMTDQDVAQFSGDQSLIGAFQRFVKKQATGTMTDEDKRQFKEIINIARRNVDRAMENRSGLQVSKLKQRLPDATPNSLKSLLSVQASKPAGLDYVLLKRKEDGKLVKVPQQNEQKALDTGNYEKVKP